MNEQELIKELNTFCKYDPITGNLIAFKHRPKTRIQIGKILGTVHSRGYLVFRLKGTLYKVHRLAWLLTYNQWPKHQIDHINVDNKDNRLNNLRDIPQSINLKNRRKSCNNTSGVTGVIFHKNTNKWFATIETEGIRHSLGYYENFNDAVDARETAEIKYGFSKRHGLG